MYKRYFGLKRAPFSIAPDPRYLYMSPQHEEAMAHLLYGIRSDGGFVLLTGEIGAGKTTICRRILETLSNNIVVAFIINPTLSVGDLLAAVCDDFGIRYPRKTSVKDLVDRINGFLLELNATRKKAILVIDEAQNLKGEVLEQIRLLTNLETNERKLLQIILIGQPELRDRLAQPDMRQLSQRIVARHHIDALSKPEVARYVNHRIAVARGARSAASRSAAVPTIDSGLFTRDALNSLYACSRGIPRLINLICDRALLGAFVRNNQIVDRATIIKAAGEVLGSLPPQAKGSWKIALTAGLLICACLGLLYVLLNGFTPHGEFLTGDVGPMWQVRSTRDTAQAKLREIPRKIVRRPLPESPVPLRDAGVGNTTGIDSIPQAKPPSQP